MRRPAPPAPSPGPGPPNLGPLLLHLPHPSRSSTQGHLDVGNQRLVESVHDTLWRHSLLSSSAPPPKRVQSVVAVVAVSAAAAAAEGAPDPFGGVVVGVAAAGVAAAGVGVAVGVAAQPQRGASAAGGGSRAWARRYLNRISLKPNNISKVACGIPNAVL